MITFKAFHGLQQKNISSSETEAVSPVSVIGQQWRFLRPESRHENYL